MTVGPYRAAVLFCLLFLLPMSVRAQLPTGEIAGVVTDVSGAVLRDCQVIILSTSTGFTLHQRTSGSGSYYAPGLNPGIYTVRVDARGFRTASVEVRVEVGRETRTDVQLQVGTASDSVTVTATEAHVNSAGATLEGVLSSQTIKQQPLNGRHFLELAQLQPGVQVNDGGSVVGLKDGYAGVSINGHSGLTTRVTVDGLDISDELLGSITQNVSLDAVDEFQITRSATDVATGVNGAGSVNIVTRSGTNELHGSGFLFWRDDALAARIAAQKFPFDREQGGVAVGGPLWRDRLFAFASYEGVNQNSAIATQVPGFPQYSKTWPLPFDEQMALARLDANLPRNARAFARFSHNGNTGMANGLGGKSLSPQLQRNNANQTAIGIDISSRRSLHSFRFGYLNYDFYGDDAIRYIPGLPATVDPGGRALSVSFSGLGLTLGPNSNAFARRLQDSREFRYDAVLHEGTHTSHWGGVVDLIAVQWFNTQSLIPKINLAYSPAIATTCGSDVLCYPVSGANVGNGLGYISDKPGFGDRFGTFHNNRIGLYVEDTWRLTSRLNLVAGARWTYEPGQDNSDLRKSPVLELFRSGLSKPDPASTTNLAPQLGVAWSPDRHQRWVVRGGVGLHYDTKLMRDRRWGSISQLPAGVANIVMGLPNQRLTDPLTGATIFDLNGADASAMITPGQKWTSRSLGTPGLIDAILAAGEAYRAAHRRAMENYPAGPGRCETERTCSTFADYRTPYTLQFNVGIQREHRTGLVLSLDYLHHRGLHYQMVPDGNRLGAADSFNFDNALAAMNTVHAKLKCALGPAGVPCALSKNATIASYAAAGLGRASTATSKLQSAVAFPGNNPAFNAVNLYSMTGWSRYNALHANLHGRLPDIRSLARNWTITASYALSRYVGTAGDQDLYWATDYYPNDNPTGFFGPTTLDRTHIIGASTTLDLPWRFRLSTIWRAASPLSQSIFLPNQNAGNAEIFKTDLNGDGATGDPLPGTNRGSYGRGAGCGAKALNLLIYAYNANIKGRPTPAGQALVDAGLFTTDQLVRLGAVAPTINYAPDGQVCLDWFQTTDMRISRPIKIRERLTIEPAWEWFNLFNNANYDLPSDRLDGHLSGIADTINGTTSQDRTNRAAQTSGTFSGGSPRSWQFALRVSF